MVLGSFLMDEAAGNSSVQELQLGNYPEKGDKMRY